MLPLSSGMDVEAVRDLARRLKVLGGEVSQLSTSVGMTSDQLRNVWRGPDVDRFIDTWHRSVRPNLQRVGDDIVGLGQSALNNAEEQNLASSAGGRGGASGSVTGSGIAVCREPSPTQKLIFRDKKGDLDNDDGVRIEYGLGEDGQVKLRISVGGTDWFDKSSLMYAGNIPASLEGNSPMADYINKELKKLAAARGFNLRDADVLLVGYSQGGMVVEDIAREGGFHSATVITVAAPRLAGSIDDVSVLRLGSPNIFNNAISIPSDSKHAMDVRNNNASYADDTGIDRSHNVVTADGVRSFGGGPLGWYLGGKEHINRDVYNSAADKFDNSGHPDDVAMRQKIGQFGGMHVRYDSDKEGLNSMRG